MKKCRIFDCDNEVCDKLPAPFKFNTCEQCYNIEFKLNKNGKN